MYLTFILYVMFAAAGQAAPPAAQAPQPPQTTPAASGPMAPERFKDIQVLTDVPADQLVTTMRYFVIATGIQCNGCHASTRLVDAARTAKPK